MFKVKAKTTVRLLILSREFFIQSSFDKDSKDFIPGLDETLRHAQFLINNYFNGTIPICDYKIVEKKVK